jgi:hypothetical protein
MPSVASLLALVSPLLCVAAMRVYGATIRHMEDLWQPAFLYLGAAAVAVMGCVYVTVRGGGEVSRGLAITGLVANIGLACSILKWGFWFAR